MKAETMERVFSVMVLKILNICTRQRLSSFPPARGTLASLALAVAEAPRPRRLMRRAVLPQRIPPSPSAMAEDDPKQKCALLMVKLQSPLTNFI